MNITRLYTRCFITVILCLLFTNGYADPPAKNPQNTDDWFNNDSDLFSDDVNEGGLKFIEPVVGKRVLHSAAVLSITSESLDSGWLGLEQCYKNLDPVDAVDLVYSYSNIKRLTITSTSGIDSARIDGQTIQLKGVKPFAFICVQAEVQILEKIKQNGFALSYGPFYRRFLDGFYPYQLSLSLNYPADLLKFTRISPEHQPLFNVGAQPGRLLVNTWFEGILLIGVEFSAK